MIQLNYTEIDRIIEMALIEDIGRGDLTSLLTIDDGMMCQFQICTNDDMVLAGIEIVTRVFEALDDAITMTTLHNDGEQLSSGDVILKGSGPALPVLHGERVALNVLRQSCGVATITRRYVDKISHTKAQLLDTRKTIPGLREIQKYSHRVGGGRNHRFRLDDGILIKDNHIAVCGSVTSAIQKAKKGMPALTRIEVECDTIDQVREVLTEGADIVLLDNMDVKTLKEAVTLIDGAMVMEASGGVNLDTVVEIAETGVDYISVGSLTNAPPNIDLSLEMRF